MTPEFKKLIEDFPEVSEENLKLIYIRDSARKAFVDQNIATATAELLRELIQLGTISEAGNDDEIRIHLANLEKCRTYLSAHIQGIRKGWAEKLEPEFKAKRVKDDLVSNVKKKVKDQGVANLVAALLSANSASKSETKTTNPGLIKVECPKCNEKVFSLKFHSCRS
jgi:hypothetical protein